MKLKVMLMVAMLALSGTAYAGLDVDGNCGVGSGAGQAKCVKGGDGGGSNGGGGGGSAAVESTNTNTNTNTQLQGQVQGQQQAAVAVIAVGNGGSLGTPDSQSVGTQSTSGTGGVTIAGNATAPFSNGNYVENNSQVGDVTSGDVTSTNTNTANGGAGGQGGTGGQAVSAAVVEAGAASAVVESGAVQYTYTERLQAPSIGQGSFAIAGCSVAGNAGGSGPGWSGFLGFGFTPSQCYDFMLAQAYQSIGEKKAVCDILRNSKAGKRQEKRGIVLPECKPEVVAVPVPVVVPPVDLSPYATKEELNRAFKASQSK